MRRALLYGGMLALAWTGYALLFTNPPQIIAGTLLLAAAAAALLVFGLPRLLATRAARRRAEMPVAPLAHGEAPQAQVALQDAAEQPQSPLRATHARALPLIAAMALACAGQYMMQASNHDWDLGFGHTLNTRYQIDLPNPDSVALACLLLAAGGALFAMGARRIATAPMEPPTSANPHPGSPDRPVLAYGLLAAAPLGSAALIWQLAGAKAYDLLPLLWIATIALALVAALLLDRRVGARLAPALDRYDLLLMAGLLLACMSVGAYQLDLVPPSMMGDEGSFFAMARMIAVGQERPSMFGLGVYSYPILGSIYQAWVMELFGPTLWSWRFSSVLAGGLAVVPTYALARELFTRRVAIAAALAMIVTPYFIAFQRLGYNNSQSIALVALALYCVYIALTRESALYAAIGGVAAGLGFYSYTAGRLALLVAVLFLGCLLVTQTSATSGRRRKEPRAHATTRGIKSFAFFALRTLDRRSRALLGLGAILAIAWAITALPHLAYANAIDPQLTRYKMVESLLANKLYAGMFFPERMLYRDSPPIEIGGERLFWRPDLYAYLLVRGGARSILMFSHDQLIREHYVRSPLPGPIIPIFFLFGLVAALRQRKHHGIALLLLWLAAGVLALSVIHAFPPRYQHTVPLIPAISIFSALGIVTFAESIAAVAPARRATIAALIAGAIVALAALTGLRNYFVDVQAIYPPSLPQLAQTTMLRSAAPPNLMYVSNDAAETDFMLWLKANTPPETQLRAISSDELTSGSISLEAGRPYVVFFHERDSRPIVAFLERALGHVVVPQIYRKAGGEVIGLSYAFSP